MIKRRVSKNKSNDGVCGKGEENITLPRYQNETSTFQSSEPKETLWKCCHSWMWSNLSSGLKVTPSKCCCSKLQTRAQVGSPSGKVQPLTVKLILHRMGIWGSSGLQRVGGSESGCPRGEEGGVIVVGGAGSAMSRDRERFHPGENEGREEGSYRSNESTREKTHG